MGAIINVNGNQITITPSELKKYEGNLPALDVRSAAVTLVASIVSRSHVDIIDAHHIFRGYSRLKQNMQELGIELVGDVKVKIEANEEEDPWDEIVDDTNSPDSTSDDIDQELQDDFIEENTI